jgi:RNA polymerase sigma-70 factor (ECF subfamily)
LEELAAVYNQARPRLVRIAYAVMGSNSDAEDVVSDCWLSLAAANALDPILDVEAWATTAVARRALDALRSARVRREKYVGPWLPEPVVGKSPGATAGSSDPADRVTLDDTVSFALMVVLETLSPAERTTWVLHDLFGMTFADVAVVVGRTPAAVRQLAARARKHVSDGAPRVDVDVAQHRTAVAAFIRAAAGGDLAGLLTALDPEVTLTSDGGGNVTAARRPVHGADRVARFIIGVAEGKIAAGWRTAPITVNGAPGLAMLEGDELRTVISLTLRDGLITRVDMVLSPDKLPHQSLDTSGPGANESTDDPDDHSFDEEK